MIAKGNLVSNYDFSNKTYVDIFYTRAKLMRGEFDQRFVTGVYQKVLQQQNRYAMKRNILYVHIPYCHGNCQYCFVDTESYSQKEIEEYLLALEKEIKLFRNTPYVQSTHFEVLYIGGGNPILLNEKQLEWLLDLIYRSFNFTVEVESSIEATTQFLTMSKLRMLQDIGIRRLSLALRPFSESLLQKYSCYEDLQVTLDMADKIIAKGYGLNIETFFGLPSQTADDLQWALEMITHIKDLKHLSIYPLRLFKNTAVFKEIERSQSGLAGYEQHLRDFYYIVNNYLTDYFFVREDFPYFYYKRGYQPHKFYLTDERVLSLGARTGFNIEEGLGGNAFSVTEYIKMLKDGEFPIESDVFVSKEQSYERLIFHNILYGYRSHPDFKKITARRFHENFGMEMDERFQKVLGDLLEKRFVYLENDVIRFSKRLKELLYTYKINHPSII